jgi:hypothetical protein
MAKQSSRRAALITVFLLSPVMARAQGPLPLDPLTNQERVIADSVVRADARVREMVGGGRTRPIHLDFISVKPRAGEVSRDGLPASRHAEVLIYNYDRNQGILALVDITARRVVDVARIPGQSVPINADEVAVAARMALTDPRVARLFGDQMPAFRVATGPSTLADQDSPRIEGIRIVGGAPNDPCTLHRCIALFFRVNNRYVQLNRVVVDLTAQQVMIREAVR